MNTVSEPGTVSGLEEFLKKNGYLAYTVRGFSMMPLLRQKKDVVMLRSKGEERCRKYDVVLYRSGDGHNFILHRVLKVRPDHYIIAGDHNTFLEYGITDDQILGVMTSIRRNGKDITMDNRLYRLYVHLWCDCYPVRMAIIRGKQRLYGYASAIRRRLRKTAPAPTAGEKRK